MAAKPKSAEMIPGPGFRVRKCDPSTRVSPEIIAGYRAFETPDISDMMNRMYTMDCRIKNLANDLPLIGPACTVKVYPGDNLMVHKALDIAEPGDILVIDTAGSEKNAVMGDLIANKAFHRGIAGFVVDGLIRDQPGVAEVGLPVFARGVTPFGPLHRGPGELNYSVSCGGVVVNPGDLIVADMNGVVVVRSEFAAEILLRLEEHSEKMKQYITDVKKGKFSNDWVDEQLKLDRCSIY